MTYEYICEQCDIEVEINCPFQERNEQVCEKCGKKLTRIYSGYKFTMEKTVPTYLSEEQINNS